MTNLEWIIKQNLKDLIQDCGETAMKIYMGEYTINDVLKCQAYRWLFMQRKEEKECSTLKKSEQQQTKNLPSFLKKPMSPEEQEEENSGR